MQLVKPYIEGFSVLPLSELGTARNDKSQINDKKKRKNDDEVKKRNKRKSKN